MADPSPAPPSAPPATLDAPLEAIVLDKPPVRVVYPYSAEKDLALPPEVVARWRPPLPPGKTYVVPQRFGVGALLAIMTGMAGLFAALRLADAPPVVFLFLGSMALTICVVQMFWGDVPRIASIVAGAGWSVLFAVGAVLYAGDEIWSVPCVAVFAGLCGAGAGYLMGTCAAGVFLVMEKLDPFLPKSRDRAGESKSHVLDQEGGPS